MKQNSKKLLLWLYSPDKSAYPLIEKDNFYWLLPDLSSSGVDSLLSLLAKQQLISIETVSGEEEENIQAVRMTDYGKTALEEEIPSLFLLNRQFDGDWTELVFLQAPKNDKNFRYLRQTLLTHKFIALSRGVFLYPGELNPVIKQLLSTLYLRSVVVFKIDDWQLGDEKLIIGSLVNLSDSFEVLSGASKEINRLLVENLQNKKLIDQQKLTINSIFNRLFVMLEDDFSLVGYFFTQEKNSLEHFFNLQKIVIL